MADRKKLSGAQNRKRKADREAELSKYKGSFKKYLNLTDKNSQTHAAQNCGLNDSLNLTQVCSSVISEPRNVNININVNSAVNISSKSTANDPIEIEDVEGETSEEIVKIDFSDPASWDSLKLSEDKLITLLVQHGLQQIQKEFPPDERKRKFSSIHYKRKLLNGDVVNRDYLQYSSSTDRVFCFCCKLFGLNTSMSLAKNGCNDWHNLAAILYGHEKSVEHINNFHKWKDLWMHMKQDVTIDKVSAKKLRDEETYWSQILERLLSLVRVLGSQNIAFRGSCEKMHELNNGNFLKFVEFLALFDPIVAEHIKRAQKKEIRHVTYLGNTIQNELIQVISNAIQNKILEMIKKAKYYSIILDCTLDISHREQMTMIVRFVDFHCSSDGTTEKGVFSVKEHFLGFIPLNETTGEAMSQVLIKQLQSLSLSVLDIRGQEYDNGSNMKGKENGLQRRILNINPCAFYVPCTSHTLNLVFNDAASCCIEVATFFDLIQRLFVFFAASTRHWEVLKRHVPSLTLKPLSDTRWSSRIDALTPIRYQLPSVYDALFEIANDITLKGSSGMFTKVEAEGLLNNISTYKFVVALVTWHSILFDINLTSKILQDKSLTLEKTIKELKKTEEILKNKRSEVEFEKVLVDAKELAERINVEPIFQVEKKRQKRKMFSYESSDEPINDPKEKFRISFYYAILDTSINSVTERFSQLNEIENVFGFIYNILVVSN